MATLGEAGHSDVTDADAPVRTSSCEAVEPVLARVGDKWSMLVVVLLGPGPRRFNALKRLVDGVSQRMLSLTLRRLERDGLVSRTVTPTIPPRVDYALTDLGQSLRLAVDGLARWAIANRPAIVAAQRHYDEGTGLRGGTAEIEPAGPPTAHDA